MSIDAPSSCEVTPQAPSRFPSADHTITESQRMKKITLLGAAVASFLAFPAVASAHTAKATIDCSAVKASYTAFAPNANGKTNTVHYQVTVDGHVTNDATFVLGESGGRQGSLTVPLTFNDKNQHTVAFFTAWGTNGATKTVDGNSAGSMTRPLASAKVTCAPPAT